MKLPALVDRHPHNIIALALAAAVLCGAAAALAAEQPGEKLKSVEQSIEQSTTHEAELAARAAKLQQESEALKRRAVEIAARERAHETELAGLEDRIAGLSTQEAALMGSLDKRRVQLAVLIAALERMARHPPAALIALPASPSDTLRSALLLRDALPEVEARAGALRHDLESLAALRESLTSARAKVADEQQSLDKERQTLASLSEEKAKLAGRTRSERESARKQSERLAGEAKDLRDLIARLANSRKRETARQRSRAAAKPPTTGETETAALTPAPGQTGGAAAGLPVAGRVLRHFGDKDEFGQPTRGVSIRVRGTAAVVAPRTGTVVFAGPFQGLGQLLIIEHGGEYHLLLAGLSRIDAAVGDRVLAGEPVGWIDASKDAQPTLYMELRRKGRPVNPLPWLAAGRTRVNG